MNSDNTDATPQITPQEQMELTFGSTRPQIAELPHLIFFVDVRALQIVVKELEEPGGVFGSWEPRFDASGEYFTLPWEEEEHKRQYIENFSLYELPENRDQIQEWCFWVDSTPIAWLIPARTPVDVLQKIYLPNCDFEEYYNSVSHLAGWLADIPWVIARLEPEGKWALVALEAGATSRLERIRSALVEQGFEPFQLEKCKDGWTWPGPLR